MSSINILGPPKVEVTNKIPVPSVVIQNPSSKPVASNKLATTKEERLQSLSNKELKAATLALARQMLTFEGNIVRDIARHGPMAAIKPESEDSRRMYSDYATVYNNALLPNAIAFRAELWRRVGAVSPDSALSGFEKQPSDTGHVDLERHPIRDAAAYLTTLANALPAR